MAIDWRKYRYLTLGTRRLNGRWVYTPIWFGRGDGCLYGFSAGDAGKVKRLRNFSEVWIAPCTALGKPLADAIPARATLLREPEDIDRVLTSLYDAYGWQMRLLDWGARLNGRYHKRAFFRIDLTDAVSPSSPVAAETP